MKKIQFSLIFVLLTLVSCKDDSLNIYPETYQTANSFFQTKTQFIQAVNGAYGPLQPIFTGQFWAMAEMRSDNTSYHYNTGDRSGFPYEELDEFREIDNNTHVASFFNNSYLSINRANVILERLPAATAVDQATRDQVTGEASFLRAYSYFNLVRLYGNVPLVLKEVKSVDEAFSVGARKPAADIYTQIIIDAQTAIAKLPDVYAATEKGRATKGAARTLLAEVYMTQKNFAGAATELKAVVASAKYSLNAAYADNFSITKENGVESVFEIQYIEGANNEASNFIYTFAPWNSAATVVGGGFAVNSGSAAGWNQPTQDLLDAYETGDLRKDVSIGTEYKVNNVVVPYVKKYIGAHAVRFQTANNFPVYRYSDVLLMLAESLNESGFAASGEAEGYLNQIRKRAGLADKKPTSQADFRAAVAQERRVELAFENHRWFDLLRYGTAEATMKAHGTKEKAAKTTVNAASYNTINLLYLYPQRETLLLPK